MPHSTDVSTPATVSTTVDERSDKSENAHLVLDQPQEPLPYWLVNVPHSQWPAECPSFLRDLPPKNIRILSMPDETYQRQNWEVTKRFVGESSQRDVLGEN